MKTTLTTIIAAAFAFGLAASVSAAPPGKGPLGFEISKQSPPQVNVQSPTPCGHNAVKCPASKPASCCHHTVTTQADACQMNVAVKHLGGADKGFIISSVTCETRHEQTCCR